MRYVKIDYVNKWLCSISHLSVDNVMKAASNSKPTTWKHWHSKATAYETTRTGALIRQPEDAQHCNSRVRLSLTTHHKVQQNNNNNNNNNNWFEFYPEHTPYAGTGEKKTHNINVVGKRHCLICSIGYGAYQPRGPLCAPRSFAGDEATRAFAASPLLLVARIHLRTESWNQSAFGRWP